MKLFKNAIVFRLSRDVIDFENLEEQLKPLAYTPCGSQDMAKTGWVPPMGKFSEQLTHQSAGQILLTAMREQKMIPSAVIRTELDKKIDKLEAGQGRKLKKTEKDSLKDEVLHSLLHRAFSQYQTINLWIDKSEGLIIVDASSAKRAEDILALLRKSLGSLPVVPLTMETPIELTMTEWVRSGSAPQGFSLMDEAELKGVLEGGGIGRFKKQELNSDEITNHLDAGKVVTRLGIDWQNRIQFTLDDSGTIKRIKFSDELRDQNDDIDREDIAQRFDADFCLMTGELSLMITALVDSLGGEAKR